VGTLFSQLPFRWNLFKSLLLSISKIIFKTIIDRSTEVFFAKTEGLMRFAMKIYGLGSTEKFTIIPLGADQKLFRYYSKARYSIRKALGISKNDIVIVYSGKISPVKDIDLLIKTLAPIMIKNSKIKLLIIGKGDIEYMRYIKYLAKKLGVLNNIIFHPWVHRTKLPELYSASDIAVWPGQSSISIVEAASVGLPLIIADYPVETYAIKYGNGFSFRPKNVNELSYYLKLLIYNSKLRKEMGRRSRLLVERELNWEAIAYQYLHAYLHALKTKNSPIQKNRNKNQ